MSLISLLWAGTATAISPVLPMLLRRRAQRGKENPARLGERYGITDLARPDGKLLWLHAASVGETISILPVLRVLADRAPGLKLLLTTGTLTSATLAAERLPALGLDRVIHQFAPLDVPRWIGRFLDHWRPDAAAFVESELWPNTINTIAARKIPLAMVNGRMSGRSFARWRRWPRLAQRLLAAFDLIMAQSGRDARRLSRLGAPDVAAPGNLKFAAPPLDANPEELRDLQAATAGRPIWLAASTHPGEDEQIIAAHSILAPTHPGLLTLIAPRHPARGADIAALAGDLPVSRRALGDGPTGAIWVLDTLGEMGLWYQLAGIVFIGGSLIPHGGQNPLEPARLGCAIAFGPHMQNFAEAVSALRAAGAAQQVTDAATLAAWVDQLLRHPDQRETMAEAGFAVSAGPADLPERVAETLLGLLPPDVLSLT